MPCIACNAELPPTARFCSQCGERVPSQPKLLNDAESEHHRLLTILFCDLVGSTAMSTRHDAEVYSEIIRGYLYDSTERLEAYGGLIARYIGDGIMAYFGYPQAKSDDVERAVLAALDVTTMLANQGPVNGEKLAVRIGIATGQVVIGSSVGRGIAREQVAMGSTPNLAARVQGIAGVNQVAICPHTNALLGNMFQYESAGEHELKGFSQTVQVWTVSGTSKSTRKSRFRATRGDNHGAMIGRDDELQTMLMVTSAKSGRVPGVLIRGQAGMGKSRLLHAYRMRKQTRDSHYLETQCDSYRSSTFLHPFIKLLADLAHFDLQQKSRSNAALAELLQSLGINDESILDTLSDFLETTSSSTRDNSLPPEGRKNRIFDALKLLLRTVASYSPIIVVFEDLHWADSSTLELLSDIVSEESLSGDSLRLIMTSRPDTDLGKLGNQVLSTVELHALTESQSRQMVEDLVGDTTLPGHVIEQLVTRAAGVPLFLEALCRQVTENAANNDTASLSNLQLPATIQGLVMERLDRLQSKAAAVQLAATFGMSFATQWLRDNLQITKEAFDQFLRVCEEQHLLSVTVSAQGESCTFQHAMVRQVAYESMLSSQRKRQHDAVARYFESEHPEVCHENPEMLGQHWQNAGNWEKGTDYLLVASERSAATWANDSAVDQLQSAISLLEDNRVEKTRWTDLWYQAHVQLGEVLVAQQRVDEAQQCYEAALQICVNNPQRSTELYRRIAEAQQRNQDIATYAIEQARKTLPDWRDKVDERSWWQESLQLDLVEGLVAYWHNDTPTLEITLSKMDGKVEQYGTPQQQADVHSHLMLLELRQNRYRVTADALQHGARFVNAARATNRIDRSASALFQEGFTLLFDGQYQRAESNMLEAQQLARESGITTVQVQVLVYLGTIYRCTGDIKRAEVLGSTGLELAREADMKEYQAMAQANLTWCAWYQGDFDRAHEQGHQALALWESLPFKYPFQWAATLPLLALAHVQSDDKALTDLLARINAEDQQKLPTKLDDALQICVNERTSDSVRQLLQMASDQGLLLTKADDQDKYF